MKIFISHQHADTLLAANIAKRLQDFHHIAVYLDAIDSRITQDVFDLSEYIRSQLGSCTQLLAVISENTKSSWWVPWEIGVATEKEQPISTYAGDGTTLPEYLKKWPYLRSQADLDEFARISKSTSGTFQIRKRYLTEAVARRDATREFYIGIKKRLGQ